MDDSIAGRTCSYLNDEFSESNNGNIKRYFIELMPEEIRRGPSPVETIKVTPKTGIKKYHCIYMNISGDIMFREFSCSCTKCTGTKYENCTMDVHCGNWIQTNLKAHPSYDTLKTYVDDNVSLKSNNHNL